MEKALAIQKEVQRILGTEEVYLVGGSVRDIVMGDEAKDYDFCTPMLPDEMEKRVQAADRKVFAVGKNFGTIGFKVPVGMKEPFSRATMFEKIEVTTFRSEVYSSKSRKPEVSFVPSLAEDLARRDFTMNAMILKSDGTIYDPYGGQLDIYAKRIRTVGKPKDRIQEDPLRILRAARFAARYNFTVDPNFIGKARQLADRIYDVSVERWVQELDKLLVAKNARVGLFQLYEMGVLPRMLPELGNEHGLVIRHSEDVDTAWKYLLDLVHENPKTARYMNTGICHRLKFSNDRAKIVLA